MQNTITSPLFDSNKLKEEEELPRITEEASILENTKIEDSTLIENQ